MFYIFDWFISSHSYVLISLGSCALPCILASLHPHFLRFVCTCLYPRTLTSLYLACIICPCLHACILISADSCVLARVLASSHPHIFRFISVGLYTRNLASHILRFMCACLYPCILTSSDPLVHLCLLVSSHPHILVSSGSCVLIGILTSTYP